ncbi:MAG: spike base protein, RCAP_Rcc01079 family [Beijerinckiaceae bacterium]
MPDIFADTSSGLTGPLIGGFAVTPHDTNDLPQVTRQLRITGTAGFIAVIWKDGTESTEPVSAGDVLDWRLSRIKATGTTATGVRGYY